MQSLLKTDAGILGRGLNTEKFQDIKCVFTREISQNTIQVTKYG